MQPPESARVASGSLHVLPRGLCKYPYLRHGFHHIAMIFLPDFLYNSFLFLNFAKYLDETIDFASAATTTNGAKSDTFGIFAHKKNRDLCFRSSVDILLMDHGSGSWG